jgi:hypothetical protein
MAALDNVPGMLPGLQLAFVGVAADAVPLRAMVEGKGGKFMLSPFDRP